MMKGEWRSALAPTREILADFWSQSRTTVVVVLALSFVTSVASVGLSYLFARLVDRVAAGGPLEAHVLAFGLYALLLGVVTTVDDALAYLSLMAARNLQFTVATKFFQRLVRKTVDFFITHNPAEIQNAQLCGEEALNDLFELGLAVFIPGVTQIVLSLALLGVAINLEIVGVVVIYGVIFVILTAVANEKTRPSLDEATQSSQDNAQFVGNAVNSMETLRHFGSERWMIGRFEQNAEKVRGAWLRFCRIRMAYTSVFGAMLAVEVGLTYFLLLPGLQTGKLSVGDLVLFNALLLQLNHPFEMIGRSINQIVRTYAHFQPFLRIWTYPEEAEAAAVRLFRPSQGQVAFEGVGFDYGEGTGVEAIDFVAERGAVTYLVGETGAGKSTLLKLALKSIEPRDGRIRVDGVDLRDISRADWHESIGVVPQEILLLNDTLATNIVLGRPFDAGRLKEAARKAAILPLVGGLPQGFETTVGERGLRLSGGERQRIAIARALYGAPAILFLDEASSALDEATEHEILSALRELAGDMTIMAITHREQVISPGDRIVRLSGGRIVAIEARAEAHPQDAL
jgi:ATP-binding cassette, subfamily B, bacterial